LSRSSKPLHYWDSCAFLALLKNEADYIDECRSVIKAAKDGKVTIVTSALTFIEVIKLEKGKPKLSKDVEEKIRGFFKHKWIYIYDLDRKIGELARDLMWQYEGLKPKDATHVATAVRAKVDVLETFDDGLIKLSGKVGNPLLPIRRPYFPNQLELFEDNT
jgi:predicted nucleic acid-binding protein